MNSTFVKKIKIKNDFHRSTGVEKIARQSRLRYRKTQLRHSTRVLTLNLYFKIL